MGKVKDTLLSPCPRKGKFLHHYENYGATAKDISDWLKK